MRIGILLAFTAIVLTSLHLDTTKKNEEDHSAFSTLFENEPLPPDTIPLKKQLPDVKGAEGKAAAAKKNLLKLIAKAIKFKKNAQVKEKAHVTAVVDEMGIKDSIAATALNMKLLMQELSKQQNLHFDSLQAIINNIKLQQKSESSQVQAGGLELNDSLINVIADKIIPLVSENEAAPEPLKEKREKISVIKELISGPATVHTQEMPGNQVKRYRLSVAGSVKLYGFCSDTGASPLRLPYYSGLFHHQLYLDGKTGNISNAYGWYHSTMLTDFQRAGGKIYCSVLLDGARDGENFFRNGLLQQKFVTNVLTLLRERKAGGINLVFKQVKAEYREDLTSLVGYMKKLLVASDTSYRIFITLPRTDEENTFDLKALDEYTEGFLADFTAEPGTICAPVAMLEGKQRGSMEAFLSHFGSANIPPSKLILLVSYRGTEWLRLNNGEFRFFQLLPYKQIRRLFTGPVSYDPDMSGAYNDTVYKSTLLHRAWYEDENTLGKKYDFVLQNKLGGVGTCYLNDDAGYSDLTDELMYKFLRIDTTFLSDSLIEKNTKLTLLQKIRRRLYLYGFILENPCAVCFDNPGGNDSERVKIQSYIADLKIDSMIYMSRSERLLHREQTAADAKPAVKEIFNYVNHELNLLILFLSLFFLLVALATGFYYLYQIRQNGYAWKWRRGVALMLAGTTVVFILLVFTLCFTNDLIPIFGVSGDSSASSSCEIAAQCINMPYSTLMFIIALSMVLGILLSKYLVSSILKQRNVP